MTGFSLQRRLPASRRSMTLVELLVTVTVIAIVAGIVLFGMSTAQEAARAAKTRALIATLHSLIMERWESYHTRRVPITIPPTDGPEQAARRRLDGIRKLMKIELPDRFSDFLDANQDASGPPFRTALQRAYSDAYKRFSANDPGTRGYRTTDDTAIINANQGAECLWMIITFAVGEGQSRKLLHESNIGDVDGDGLPEILDGWGKPISFIRWPAGFLNTANRHVTDLQTGDWANDHDPFDPMRVDPQAYRLVPLIYSAGPDGGFDINVHGTYRYDINAPNPYFRPPSNLPSNHLIGTPMDTNSPPNGEEWQDNIHNHRMGG